MRTLLYLLFAVLVFADPASADSRAARNYIVYSPNPSAESFTARSRGMEREVGRHRGTTVARLPLIAGAVVAFKDEDFNTAAEQLEAQGYAVEPDYPVHAFDAPNDPYFKRYQQDMLAINAPQAWSVATGSAQVVVAVLDTGIDYKHPDLKSNIWRDPVTGSRGWNFVRNNGRPLDDNRHGTHVAGTIGAVGNNGIGVSGVNWNVQLMALKVLDSSASGKISSIIMGVQYAVAARQKGVNIRVINASLGGPNYSGAFQQAINSAYRAGILFVAAAGNNGSDLRARPSYPAAYDNVLSVAAVDNNGRIAPWSNYSPIAVQLAAPGVEIFSTIPKRKARRNPYGRLSGTSMAAPHVSGAAALLFSTDPSLTPEAVKSRLIQTAVRSAAVRHRVSAGVLDVLRALTNN